MLLHLSYNLIIYLKELNTVITSDKNTAFGAVTPQNGCTRLFVGGYRFGGNSIWKNYLNFNRNEYGAENMWDHAYNNLAQYNAQDVKGQPYLDFLTEEDALIFSLKFSK